MRVAGEPLLLTPGMRSALSSAVRVLLDDARLAEAGDPVRLTAVLMLAKAQVSSACVETMSRDLAGWLGYGISHVAHTVVPEVRASGIATCERSRDAAGWTYALRFELLALKEARAERGLNPLSLLNKRDLATLLRFCEAVLCPGWAPKDKPATPAGFLAARRGRRAATDRLAMLLLALEAREDGRVRMPPGRLPQGYNRAEVTVARLLGCTVDAAVAVLKRLLAMGAVTWDRPERFGKNRLLVPAIRSAYERARASVPTAATVAAATGSVPREPVPRGVTSLPSGSGSCARCEGAARAEPVLEGDGWAQLTFEDVPAEATDSACRDQIFHYVASTQVKGGLDGGAPADSCADPHTSHPPVVSLASSSTAVLGCFSGSAVLGGDRLRERAHAGADKPEIGLAVPEAAGKADPLRGEQPTTPPAPATHLAGRSSVFARPVVLPRDLERVLGPVAGMWAGLGLVSTGRWLAKAVRLELVRLRNLVGDEGGLAERRLAERLKRRLERQGSRPVQDLAGWLIKRGLPQKSQCWSTMCDDGIRIDTGSTCESCGCLIGDRRGLRTMMAAHVADQYGHLPAGEWRTVYESELRAHVDHQAAVGLVRRERTAQRRGAFRAAVEERKAQLAAAQAERAARPCADCDQPDAAGLCMTCSLRRATAELVEQAVDIAVAVRADIDDRRALSELTTRVARDTWMFVRGAEPPEGSDDAVSRAYAERESAKRVLEHRRQRAWERLRASEPAEFEAAHVKRMALRGTSLTDKDIKRARKAAGEARDRVAKELLREFLGDLYRVRAAAVPPESAVPWSERCTGFAERPSAEGAVTASVLADE